MRKWSFYWLLIPCLGIILLVMGWFSYSMMVSEEARMMETRHIRTLEQARVVLWRMDSDMASMIAREDARSPEEYLTGIADTGHPVRIGCEDSHLTSFSLLYFQLDPDGKVHIPLGNGLSSKKLGERLEWLKNLETSGRDPWLEIQDHDWEKMPGQLGSIAGKEMSPPPAALLAFGGGESTRVIVTSRSVGASSAVRTSVPLQQAREDLVMRRQMVEVQKARVVVPALSAEKKGTENGAAIGSGMFDEKDSAASERDISITVMKTLEPSLAISIRRTMDVSPFRVWQDDAGNWFLIRKVVEHGRIYRQGIWLDRDKLTERLLQMVPLSLPGARLRTPENDETRPESRQGMPDDDYMALASLPIVLEPGSIQEDVSSTSNLLLSMGVAWACVLVAVLGVIGFAVGMARLNERRSVFVSAVTHELRTPLTTFNMYTEMLGSGLVPPGKTASYLETLRREASRLTHLVDNVLTYSRVEKKSARIRSEELCISRLASSVEGRITPRVIGAGMDLQLCVEPGLDSASVLADLTAVEQIVYNLVDNAVKYAHIPEGIVRVDFKRTGKLLRILVTDPGKGIDSAFWNRLFQPFSRSAEDAAGNKPGVGLGLALSRELAKAMKGSLKLKSSSGEGTCFELILPLSSLHLKETGQK